MAGIHIKQVLRDSADEVWADPALPLAPLLELEGTDYIPNVAKTLSAIAEECGVALSQEVDQALARYLELLERWGRSINLTGDPSAVTVIARQLPDAFQLASLIEPHRIEGWLDAGAGAGLVAVPLGLLRPGLRLTLVEPNQKRCAFLRTVAYELKLPLVVRAERLETIQERYESVMSRATWAPERWVEEARRVIAPGGSIVVFSKGEQTFDGLEAVGRRHYTLEGGGERCVSIWRER